jgi:type III pantothenate kinase
LIEGIIKRIKKETKTNSIVIATGGLSNLFSKHCSAIQLVDEDLTIKGLVHIFNINN